MNEEKKKKMWVFIKLDSLHKHTAMTTLGWDSVPSARYS